jgi:hypothetical protein
MGAPKEESSMRDGTATEAPVINRQHRDALREAIRFYVGCSVELASAFDAPGLERTLARDGLRLVDDLGWDADDPREQFELTLSDDALRRVLDFLRAEETKELDNARRSTNRYVADQALDTIVACRAVEAAE